MLARGFSRYHRESLADLAELLVSRQAISGHRPRPLLRIPTLLAKNSFTSNSDLGRPKLYPSDNCWFITSSEQILGDIVIANKSREEMRRRGEGTQYRAIEDTT